MKALEFNLWKRDAKCECGEEAKVREVYPDNTDRYFCRECWEKTLRETTGGIANNTP